MKFVIIKDNLQDALGVVEKIESENVNLPILKNCLLSAENNGIKITATNLEIAVSCATTGRVIQEGKYTAPIKLLSSIINNIQSDRLNIEQKETKIEIKTDNYEAVIQGISPDEFPPTPKIKNQEFFIEIKASTLKDAVGQILVSSQQNDLRPELNSILLDFSITALKFVATDSFRLSEKTITPEQFESNHNENFKLLIPLKTVGYLLRAFKDEEVVRIYHDENQILFKTTGVEILSRLIEGNFPDYAGIIPKKFTTEIIVKKNDFLNALKLISVFSNKSNEVKLLVQENKKIVEISSQSDALGENKYILSGKIKGGAQEIVFNWRYVGDALKALKTEEVFMGINGEGDPAEIKSAGDGSYFYILKPIAGA
ncbi:MAG: DNA polymerase III subunit beta [Candidatus Ryanbacteria bacterium RIFCSPLOWO2_01_FULL_48_26]|uniref:Beta sliding clamp n=1 Tax=Candidatus Ryanbacteria bacterium RIFCSPLOWO2_01_FULL_48_26 TaxID=1802126 RepID=A0A1G2GR38_9BACT|nr:MAG: DNA polymerase III subunit beta [Candidatus Ryanbacteria bacterium RIFCSPLOWO2_01_FULL_48_26]